MEMDKQHTRRTDSEAQFRLLDPDIKRNNLFG